MKGFQVVGDVDKSGEHVFDGFIEVHLEQFIRVYVHIHLCLWSLNLPFIGDS